MANAIETQAGGVSPPAPGSLRARRATMIPPEQIAGNTLYRITPRGRGKFLYRRGRVEDMTKITAGEIYQAGFIPQRLAEAGLVERIKVVQEEKIEVVADVETPETSGAPKGDSNE